MPETTKLLGNTESNINLDENSEKVPHLETTEVLLIHCNIFNNDYQHGLTVLYKSVPNKSLVNYETFHQIILYF